LLQFLVEGPQDFKLIDAAGAICFVDLEWDFNFLTHRTLPLFLVYYSNLLNFPDIASLERVVGDIASDVGLQPSRQPFSLGRHLSLPLPEHPEVFRRSADKREAKRGAGAKQSRTP